MSAISGFSDLGTGISGTSQEKSHQGTK